MSPIAGTTPRDEAIGGWVISAGHSTRRVSDPMLLRALAYAIWLAGGAVATGAVLSTWLLSLELVLGRRTPAMSLAALLGGIFTVAVVLSLAGLAGRTLAPWLREVLAAGYSTRWVLGILIAGLVLRLLWGTVFDAPQQSDGATYFKLAERLYTDGVYRDDRGDLAYWPPGYPLFLLAHFMLFGVKPWIPLLGNLVLFGVATVGTYFLARSVLDETAARLAAVLLALWPNYIFSSGVASKEMLLTALLSLAILLYVMALREAGLWRARLFLLIAGVLLGLASLSQPSMLVFPTVLVLHMVLCRRNLIDMVVTLTLLAVGMLATIGPWTARNAIVFKAPVLISTNGGDVFYRANNTLATGGYTPTGERDLRALGELERNRAGYQWGTEWIRSHPDRFLALAVRKDILFLGDDSTGAYESLKRDRPATTIYLAAKGLSNVYWLGIWTLILWALWRHGPRYRTADVLLMALPVMYLLGIDSLYESGARHHVPVMGFLALLAGGFVSGGFESDRADFPNRRRLPARMIGRTPGEEHNAESAG